MVRRTTLVVLLGTVTISLWAQPGGQGSVAGIVTDPSGAVIVGAAIKARNLNTSAIVLTNTNEAGLFWFSTLPVGPYEISAEYARFSRSVINNVVVTVGGRIDLSIPLQPAGRADMIAVDEQGLGVETTRSQVSTMIDSRLIRDLPVNGRDVIEFVLLTPGVTRDVRGGLSFAGQRAMNSLLVDGNNNDDHFFDQPQGGQGFGNFYDFSQDAVQEFQVNANSYSAEFGRAGGGVINTVTKSGTNDFHGSGFWFFRDRSLNANDAVNKMFGVSRSAYHFNQFGGTLGGPVVRNKAFFFASYDGLRSRFANTTAVNLPPNFQLSPDPAVAAYQRRALDYLAPRAFVWSEPLRQNDYLAKVDWQLASAHLLSIRWNRQAIVAPSLSVPSVTQIAAEHGSPSSDYSDTLAASLRSALSGSMVNAARFTYRSDDGGFNANSPNPEARVQQSGRLVLAVGRAPGSPQSIPSRRAQGADTLTWLRGRHNLKVGTDVLVDRITRFTTGNFSGSYTFFSLESFGRSLAAVPVAAGSARYTQAFSGEGRAGVTVHPNITEFAGFFQDEWRAASHLNLNLGLRYDVQLMAKPSVRNPSPALATAGLDTSFLRNEYGNFAPRVGLAWSPLGKDRLVVRGGYGVFFGETPGLIIASASYLNGVTVRTLTLSSGTANAELFPSYPNSICGPPDPSGVPPSCPVPPVSAGNLTLLFFNRNYRQPNTQQGNMGLEVQIGKGVILSANYLVTKGTHLQRVRDVNLGLPETPQIIEIAGTSQVLQYNAFTLPRPASGFDRLLTYASDANSIYRGLVVQLNKRFSNTFQLLGSYTLSKVIDDAPNVYIGNPGPQDGTMLSDSMNPRADRSAGLNDQRHRLVISGVWELNYGRRLPRAARSILTGWKLSGILAAQSGQPYSGFVNSDLNNDGNLANDRTPGQGRNTFYMPATISFDPRLTRSVSVSERARLEFIWEAFNVFNRRNVSAANTTEFALSTSFCGTSGAPCLVPLNTGLTAFGLPTATSGPRIMQLAARFIF